MSPVRLKNKKGFTDVPCGKCLSCLSNKRQSWSFRIEQELKNSVSAYFITLTYNDESCKTLTESGFKDMNVVDFLNGSHPSLCKSDLSLFLKRLRTFETRDSKKYYETIKMPQIDPLIGKIRYFAVGEYGGEGNRPHYHILLFNCSSYAKEHLEEIWNKGFVHVGKVEPASIMYVVSYVVNPNYCPEGQVPTFSVMSKGIGQCYLTPEMIKYHKDSQSMLAHSGSSFMSLPRYYRDKIFNNFEKSKYAQKKAMEISVLDSSYTDENPDSARIEIERFRASKIKLSRISKNHKL